MTASVAAATDRGGRTSTRDGWSTGRLDEHWAVIDCKHITAKFTRLGFPVASIGEVQSRYVDLRHAPRTTRPFYLLLTQGERTPAPGDLIISRNATVGAVAIVADWHPLFAMGQDVCLLRRRNKRTSPEYLQFLLQSPATARHLSTIIAGSTFKRLNVSQIKSLKIDLPPPADQAIIAERLGAVEDVLVALNRLIAKKEAIKQGLMQQLVSGMTRLPGFVGRWRDTTIGELARIVSGGTPKTSVPSYWDGGIAWCTPTDITSQRGRFLQRTVRTISQEGLERSAAQLLPVGSLLLCTRATVGEVKIATTPIATNQGFKSLVPRLRVSGVFLYYKVLTTKDELAAKGTGSTFLEVSKRDVASLEFRAPEFDEQAAIASVLEDADDEIDALERRLAKARSTKVGMMQELLIGHPELAASKAVA